MSTIIVTPNFKPIKRISVGTLQTASPYSNAKAAFNWLNVSFPYMHTHNHWEILVIVKGKLLHTINGKQEIGEVGYAYLVRPEDSHRLDYVNRQTDVEYINFIIENESIQRIFALYEQTFDFSAKDIPFSFNISLSNIEEIKQQALTAQSEKQTIYEQLTILIIHQLIVLFLSQKLIVNVTYPTWLNDFLNLLKKPQSFHMNVQELASTTSYSYSHLSRLFKEYLNKTLVEYINETKMAYAKRMLRTTTKSILEISLDLGFSSVSSLNHKFKETFSVSPQQYRKKHTRVEKV